MGLPIGLPIGLPMGGLWDGLRCRNGAATVPRRCRDGPPTRQKDERSNGPVAFSPLEKGNRVRQHKAPQNLSILAAVNSKQVDSQTYSV